MKASDVMTVTVISADPDATVLQAARYMLQHHISGLPVIDKTGKLPSVSFPKVIFSAAVKLTLIEGAHAGSNS